MSAPTWTPDTDLTVRLLEDLQTVKLHDGDPSLGELEKRTKDTPRFVSKATFSRALAGTRLPKWWIVETFLLACNIDEQEIATYWKPRWVLAAGGSQPSERPGAQAEHACPVCGTMPEEAPTRPQLTVVPA